MKKTFEQIKAEIYNGVALESDAPVFVAYGITEAQAIQNLNVPVVSLGDIEPLEFAAALSGDSTRIIIAYPSGQEGETKAGVLESALRSYGVSFYRADPGALYLAGNAANSYATEPAAFALILGQVRDMAIKTMAEARLDRYRKKVVGGEDLVLALRDRIQHWKEGIQTGFHFLDNALGDGLPPGLIVIGAIPSVGKTTFALQIADHIAASKKRDVLYIAMEQAASELAAKSISRLSGNFQKSGEEVLNNYKIRTNYNPKKIENLINKYAETIAPNMFICAPREPTTPDDIANIIRAHVDARGSAPVVFLDYLQLLAPQNIRYTEKQANDYAALKLKSIGEDLKTPVVCISSFNRMNYSQSVSLESFKESGGIEYGADVAMGIQLYGTGTLDPVKKKYPINPDAEKRKQPCRRIEVCILKNRAGETGQTLYFNYFAGINLFYESKGPRYLDGNPWELPEYKIPEVKSDVGADIGMKGKVNSF